MTTDDDVTDKEWLAILLHRFESSTDPTEKSRLATEMRELAEAAYERIDNGG